MAVDKARKGDVFIAPPFVQHLVEKFCVWIVLHRVDPRILIEHKMAHQLLLLSESEHPSQLRLPFSKDAHDSLHHTLLQIDNLRPDGSYLSCSTSHFLHNDLSCSHILPGFHAIPECPPREEMLAGRCVSLVANSPPLLVFVKLLLVVLRPHNHDGIRLVKSGDIAVPANVGVRV